MLVVATRQVDGSPGLPCIDVSWSQDLAAFYPHEMKLFHLRYTITALQITLSGLSNWDSAI